jgi:hypothetical protein
MSAPDFYFAVNAIFRHVHENRGHDALIDYWRELGRDYYRERWKKWQASGLGEIARDWEEYFGKEPQAEVAVSVDEGEQAVDLDIAVCPAIKHLRDQQREIVPYFCEHCDHICGSMAEAAGYRFERTGGMGSCHQRFIKLSVQGSGKE